MSDDPINKSSDEESRDLESDLAQNGLPFKTEEEAEDFLFGLRDRDLDEIDRINERFPVLQLDYRPSSLKRLESFYFDCFVEKTTEIDTGKEKFEELMTQYMREVFVTNDLAEWMVFENDFARGRFDLGILYNNGSGSMEHYADMLDEEEDNTARTLLYDTFMMYVPDERKEELQ